MTEAEWLTSTDAAAMLDWRQGGNPLREPCPLPPLSPRKLRLYAAGLCRLVWDGAVCGRCGGTGKISKLVGGFRGFEQYKCLDCRGTGRTGGIPDHRSRRAVETAERYADGEATRVELRHYAEVGTGCCATNAADAARYVLTWVEPHPPPATQADLLRCIAGNPFRPVRLGERCPVCEGQRGYQPGEAGCVNCTSTGSVDPPWLTPTALAVARRIYDERQWQDCPILADALEDAGCAEECERCRGNGKMLYCRFCRGLWVYSGTLDYCPTCRRGQDIYPVKMVEQACPACGGSGVNPSPILAHLRGPGPHARGCWAVDLVLGKE